MRLDANDTIAAVSTPPGENGIGIVRLSGASALDIADRIFRSNNGGRPSALKTHSLHYGHIVDDTDGRELDEVLLTVMRAPRTYTREDIVEINCHGGITAVKAVLDLVVRLGARIAQPGEFTKRAFLNGRIDLMQAEAVLDIISSRTKEGLSLAHRQLSGETSARIKAVRAELIDIMARIEAEINFPDEEIAPAGRSFIRDSLCAIEKQLWALLEASDKGLILREGITTVICGKPNVGKSTLMNTFLKRERVIVTPVPGTTRDSIEEIVNIRGIPLKIVDTAGIMHAVDEIAKESVERSRRCMEEADLILLMLDSNDILDKEDFAIIDMVRDKKTLVVVNKTDLPEVLQVDEIKRHLHDKRLIRISAREKSGIKDLEDAIYDMFWQGSFANESILLSNSRHIEAVIRAEGFIRAAVAGIDEAGTWETVSIDIREAAGALGAVTGEVFTDDLLTSIFSRFCIGK